MYLLLLAALSITACKKHTDPPQTELQKLPPATQTGANTFGALVNGTAFVPYDPSFYSHSYQCNYIYTNGGYYFYVFGANTSSYNYTTDISISTNSLPISEGQTLKLENKDTPGKAYGLYTIINNINIVTHQTTNIVSGQLYISKLDQVKQIVSGTFYFKAINLANGDTVRVTDGRFDMQYTQ